MSLYETILATLTSEDVWTADLYGDDLPNIARAIAHVLAPVEAERDALRAEIADELRPTIGDLLVRAQKAEAALVLMRDELHRWANEIATEPEIPAVFVHRMRRIASGSPEPT